MKKKNNRRGFTMAELLIVVAIIGILSGVGFVAVQLHQKSLAQLEANSIAKEIFIAAQNHLTMAESQGYLKPGSTGLNFGTSDQAREGDPADAKEIYYVKYPGNELNPETCLLGQMLPFGAIDETVRAGGNYVIRYQANPARVLDVWYGKPKTESFKGGYTGNPVGLVNDETFGLVSEMNHDYGSNNVIGWYGGDTALEIGVVLQAPSITVENAERLTVTVDMTRVLESAAALADPSKVSVKLIIEGETSGAMAAIPILPSQNHRVTQLDALDGNEYVVTLDDITQAYNSTNNDGLHFAEINNFNSGNTDATGTKIDLANGTAFIPGENITVSAVTFDNAELASIEYSNEVTTNSLFADVVDASEAGVVGVTSGKVAMISNIRHLENLDTRVSGLHEANQDKLTIVAAEQTVDLAWEESGNASAFTSVIATPSIYQKRASTGTTPGCFLPVNISYPLVYDGGIEPAVAPSEDGEAAAARYHTITGVKVSTTATGDPAGLFGTLDATNGAVTIRNLELLDFDITGTGSAGALAGKAQGAEGKYVTIRNVLAHNPSEYDTDKDLTVTVKSNGGNAGGLVGEMTFCNMTNCAAALVVSSTSTLGDTSNNNNAGGLVGKASGTITGCYSGGHTNDGAYSSETYNVTSANGAAGGLVGDAGGSHIKFSYSTCSASGTTAGGLVGKSTVSTGRIDVSYATGLVSQQGSGTAGAFAGNYSGTMKGCLYLEIINEKKDSSPLEYLQPVGNVTSTTGVTAIDASASSYNEFSGSPATDWKTASPYDETLATLYQNMYNLKSIDRLENGKPVTGVTPVQNEDKVKTTATTTTIGTTTTTPADFVATHYGDWPAPEILVINTKSE